MDLSKAYDLKNKLTKKNVENVVGMWNQSDIYAREMKEFKALVRLGDSDAMACATVLVMKQQGAFDKDSSMCQLAYY